jgi:hypothetical protein
MKGLDVVGLARALRESADHIEKAVEKVLLPTLECNITQAAAKLKMTLNREYYFSIQPPQLTFTPSGCELGKWRVYFDGADKFPEGKAFESPTLAEAVNAAVAAWSDGKNPPNAIDSVQEQLCAAAAESLPL